LSGDAAVGSVESGRILWNAVEVVGEKAFKALKAQDVVES
jgi:hypothetical protein